MLCLKLLWLKLLCFLQSFLLSLYSRTITSQQLPSRDVLHSVPTTSSVNRSQPASHSVLHLPFRRHAAAVSSTQSAARPPRSTAAPAAGGRRQLTITRDQRDGVQAEWTGLHHIFGVGPKRRHVDRSTAALAAGAHRQLTTARDQRDGAQAEWTGLDYLFSAAGRLDGSRLTISRRARLKI